MAHITASPLSPDTPLGVLADEVLGRSGTDTPGGNRALLLRIQEFIDRHLADPT
ncbi:hypothetical protein ABZV61_35015 [Streptomyces sp900116325]|uniref:Uncharacterized protein n=1 Tax=Streptomyces sp. 900116325 TaxID=3154295 RepID=A0ABV2UM72_9ACTN